MHPWLLARLLAGASASLLLLAATRTSLRVLRRWDVGALNEGQVTLARRAELVAAIVQAALFIAIGGLALTTLAADRLSGSIRGAMCAFGVLSSTDSGFEALGTSAAAALACALWLVLHRLDMELRAPVLTRRKFVALLFVAPLVWVDFATTLRFALQLDFTVVSSCCSVSLDGADLVWGASRSSMSPALWSIASVTGVLAAVAASIGVRRRPGGVAAWTAAVASIVAAAACLPAILFVVAPYAYETPHHLCPFCLLHADVWGIGWPLYAALFAGTALGLGIGVAELQRRASGEPQVVSALQRAMARWAIVMWIVVLVVGAAPVLAFMVRTGGASLLGGS